METLNSARILLVAGAVFAALLAAVAGQWAVVAILLIGIAAHAGLWVHLYGGGRHGTRRPGATAPPSPARGERR